MLSTQRRQQKVTDRERLPRRLDANTKTRNIQSHFSFCAPFLLSVHCPLCQAYVHRSSRTSWKGGRFRLTHFTLDLLTSRQRSTHTSVWIPGSRSKTVAWIYIWISSLSASVSPVAEVDDIIYTGWCATSLWYGRSGLGLTCRESNGVQ